MAGQDDILRELRQINGHTGRIEAQVGRIEVTLSKRPNPIWQAVSLVATVAGAAGLIGTVVEIIKIIKLIGG